VSRAHRSGVQTASASAMMKASSSRWLSRRGEEHDVGLRRRFDDGEILDVVAQILLSPVFRDALPVAGHRTHWWTIVKVALPRMSISVTSPVKPKASTPLPTTPTTRWPLTLSDSRSQAMPSSRTSEYFSSRTTSPETVNVYRAVSSTSPVPSMTRTFVVVDLAGGA